MFSFGTPLTLNRLAQAIAEAPAPVTTTFISLMDLPKISKALIKPAKAVIAVPCYHHEKLEYLMFLLIFVL